MPSTKEMLPSSSSSSSSSSSTTSPSSIINDNNLTVEIENNNNPINSRRSSWPSTIKQQQQQLQNNQHRQKENGEEEEDDPIWLKWKGTIGRQIGNLESSLGSMVGLHGLENSGQQWKEWGTNTIDHANELTEQGAPSRIDGEYNRAMGFIGKTLGHIIGDEEMEYNNVQRIHDANEEITQTRKNL